MQYRENDLPPSQFLHVGMPPKGPTHPQRTRPNSDLAKALLEGIRRNAYRSGTCRGHLTKRKKSYAKIY